MVSHVINCSYEFKKKVYLFRNYNNIYYVILISERHVLYPSY